MRSDLILVGASGLARETADAVAAGRRYRVIGVVDDDASTWETGCGEHPVLGGLDVVATLSRARVAICVGKGASRRAIAARLGLLGVDERRYATVVHPEAVIGATSTVGVGTILLACVVATADAWIGRHVVAMPNAVITHDDVIGDYATLCAGVTLAGGVTVGFEAYVGASAAVRENLAIGSGATIGIGAVVVRDVPPSQTWVGNPARELLIPAAVSPHGPSAPHDDR